MAIIIGNNGLGGKLKISGASTGGFKARYVQDLDAEAFFARVSAAGGTLSALEQNAIITLVISLKNADVWTSMKAIYPMVGSSAAACAQNLKSTNFTGTFSGAWAFTSAGAKGNGVNTFMNTGILPSTELSINTAHMSVYMNTANNANAVLIGANSLNTFLQTQSGILYGSLGNTSFSQNAITGTVFFIMINRPSNTVQKLIRNNTVLLSDVKTATAYTNAQNIYVGAYTSTSNNTDATIAFSSIGDGMTDTQASNFYTAIQAFQTTLNRQV
jgi:hypothetical protein